MASEYTYDEEGETWPFFVLALLSFVLIPLTIQYGYRITSQDDPVSINSKIPGSITLDELNLNLENLKQVASHRKSQKTKKVFNKKLLFLALGWAFFLFVARSLTPGLGEAQIGAFDPYEILDISAFSSEKDVKSRYRKLSLKFHPDKLPKDLTDAQKEEMEANFIQINLAYKSLTDEVTRNNFLKYGHPDGPQEVKHGIALPKFLVEGKYSLGVVLLYFVLIGGILPFIVGSWWNNVKTHTKRGIHIETAASFAKRLADRNPAKIVTQFDILEWLLASHEIRTGFAHLLPNGAGAPVTAQVPGAPSPSSIVVRDLVSRHIFRNFELSEKEPKYEVEKLKILATLPKLLSALIEIATVFRQVDVVLAAMEVSKNLNLAVSPIGKYQELLQLPYVDAKVVQAQPVKKLGKFVTLSKEEQKKVLGITDDSKLAVALEVASHVPQIRILDASFVVPGENNEKEGGLPHGSVPLNANAHLSVKFLVKSPKHKSCPDIDDEKLRDEETIDYMRNPISVNEAQPQLPYSFTPYSPNDTRNGWQGVLISQRDNKILEGSNVLFLENANLHNLEITQEQYIKGQVEISTFKAAMTTPTPGVAGEYPFRLVLKNNAYFGCDVDVPVIMTVATPPNPEKTLLTKKVKKIMEIQGSDDEDEDDEDDESDISDPEEDSIAGALAALRGGAVKKAAVDEDDDEDEDEEEVFTDINTDTEDEGEI